MTGTLDLAAHRTRLATVMAERGAWPTRTPWIREAVAALPRDLLAPERLWRWDGHAWVPVDRAADPEGWAGLLYGTRTRRRSPSCPGTCRPPACRARRWW